MHRYSAEQIAAAVSGELISGPGDAVFRSVSTDSRQLDAGNLFVALKGDKFDAHDFIVKAVDGGAGGLVVSRPVATGSWPGPVILVQDTLRALQDLARHNRMDFRGPVIGVTGSTGKTTVKDMVGAVLEQKFKTLKTAGNFNNEIGLPLTLLKLDDTFGAAVLEMGMRGLGEIAFLAGLARPVGAIITNIGETHLERLGSVENIALAKGEILDAIPPEGFAILNGDDPRVRGQAGRCRGTVIFFGTGPDAQVRAEDIESDGRGASFTVEAGGQRARISLPLPGRHNVLNALAAAAVGLQTGVAWEDIIRGLSAVRLTPGRQEILESKRATLINDTYNANPASVKAALQVLAELGRDRRKVAILGDMLELGPRAAEGHREVGEEAAARQVDVLITVGLLAREIALGATLAEHPPGDIISLNTNQEMKEYLPRVIQPGDVVLVKGSRGMKMEEIVTRLVELE